MPPPPPCGAGKLLPINPRSRNVDELAGIASSSPPPPTSSPPDGGEGGCCCSSAPPSGEGRLNCPKASCMVIVPPYPRLAVNNKRTPKLMVAAIIAALHLRRKLSFKKEN